MSDPPPPLQQPVVGAAGTHGNNPKPELDESKYLELFSSIIRTGSAPSKYKTGIAHTDDS